jgi:Calpain family cysteine protease
MDDLVGLQPEQVRDLAHRFDVGANQFAHSRQMIQLAVYAAWWAGPAADQFRSRWNSTLGPSLGHAKQELHEAAVLLRRQLNEQIETSRPGESVAGPNFRAPGNPDLKDPKANVKGTTLVTAFGVPLFDDGPSPDDVFQGRTGDCWVMSSLAAIAASNYSARVQSMITDNADGTYTVRFADGSTQRVDSDFYLDKNGYRVYASFGQPGRPELWAAVIEKAYAQRGRNHESGYGSIDGGFQADALRTLIGGHGHKMKTSDDHLENTIIDRFGEGIPLTASASLGNPAGFSGYEGNHAFTITDVEQHNGSIDLITVRNPWGHNEDIVAANLSHEMGKNGTIQLTYAEFKRFFYDVEYVTDIPS